MAGLNLRFSQPRTRTGPVRAQTLQTATGDIASQISSVMGQMRRATTKQERDRLATRLARLRRIQAAQNR